MNSKLNVLEEYRLLKLKYLGQFNGLSLEQLRIRFETAENELKTIGQDVSIMAKRAALLDLMNDKKMIEENPDYYVMKKVSNCINHLNEVVNSSFIPELRKLNRVLNQSMKKIEERLNEKYGREHSSNETRS